MYKTKIFVTDLGTSISEIDDDLKLAHNQLEEFINEKGITPISISSPSSSIIILVYEIK